jgi:peptidoglycan/LPS O-acetylase OafA/YrhL
VTPAIDRPEYATGAIPSLDGIRAVAVSLVFFAHGGADSLVPGGLGVTIFFVLSGYLITTLMRIEHARSGGISYRSFYLRRLLRLMPPLSIVVAAAGLLALASVIDGGFTPGGLFSALFYFGNYYVISHDFDGMPAGLGVVWSLAIEEHYYLLYPPLAALLLRFGRVGLSVTALSMFCAAVLAWRCWLVAHGGSGPTSPWPPIPGSMRSSSDASWRSRAIPGLTLSRPRTPSRTGGSPLPASPC